MTERLLSPGDHIRVRRFHLYWHHGIYISDARVIEFGGGNLFEKYRAAVRPTSLQQFESRGVAQAVLPKWEERHSSQESISRAEYLSWVRRC